MTDGVSGVDYGGGGSGGGIWMTVGSISGSGRISAQGGNSSYGGAGGGGRIAVYSDTLTLPGENITTLGGISGDGSVALKNGSPGTVYFR